MPDDHRTTTAIPSFERIGQFQSPFTPQNSGSDVGADPDPNFGIHGAPGNEEFTVAEAVQIQSDSSNGSGGGAYATPPPMETFNAFPDSSSTDPFGYGSVETGGDRLIPVAGGRR
jgi:hypothetical protein